MGNKITLEQVKNNVTKTIVESRQIARAIIETEKDENKREIITCKAEVKALSNSVDYLYTVIETLL